MAFELTKSLIDDIIFSMEDQNAEFVFDAESACLVPLDSLDESESENLEENENIYPLPDWSSDDGFEIMEKFAESVRIPKIQHELQQVLSNGRGVFRNFKNVLKQYPHIEKRFHAFKEAKMRSVVVEWYNSLRDSWGLEKLSQDFEDYEDLVQQDFEFRPYNHQKDNDCILKEAELISGELKASFDGEAGQLAARLWMRKFDYEKLALPCGVVCRTLSGDFAACLLFSQYKESFTKKAVALTSFFVNQNYRGLGIARELFSRGISYLKEQGIQSIIADSVLPDFFEPLFARCGFEKKGSLYVADLADK